VSQTFLHVSQNTEIEGSRSKASLPVGRDVPRFVEGADNGKPKPSNSNQQLIPPDGVEG